MTSRPPSRVTWIRAHVDSAVDFDRAQQLWRGISGFPALVGQSGGWSANEGTAVVVTLWVGRDAHRAYRTTAHDHVADQQRQTYTSFTAELLDVQARSAVDWMPASIGRGGILRTADCELRPGRFEHALEIQRDLWLPAMHRARMQYGLLARRAPPSDAIP